MHCLDTYCITLIIYTYMTYCITHIIYRHTNTGSCLYHDFILSSTHLICTYVITRVQNKSVFILFTNNILYYIVRVIHCVCQQGIDTGQGPKFLLRNLHILDRVIWYQFHQDWTSLCKKKCCSPVLIWHYITSSKLIYECLLNVSRPNKINVCFL